MKIVECKGSHRQVGQIMGEALRPEIHSHIQGFLSDTARQNPEIPYFAKTLRNYAPEVLEQLNGMAQGAAVAEHDILALNAPYGKISAFGEVGCSNIVFADGPDGPIWGKNNEGGFPPPEGSVRNGQGRRPVCVLKVQVDGCIPALCVTFCGWLSGGDMMNAEGVAIGHSSVGSIFDQSPHHVSVLHWLYVGMLRVRTTDELAAHLTRLPLRGKGFAHVAVDRAGAMIAPELACPLVQIRRPAPRDKAMNCVNYYQLPALHHADQRNQAGIINAHGRRGFLDAAAQQGDRSLAHMQQLLRHHGDFSICRHGGRDLSYTEYSMIGLCSQRSLLVCEGYPCQGHYQKVTL